MLFCCQIVVEVEVEMEAISWAEEEEETLEVATLAEVR